jgi:LysW-gamma-L-lysine carboxypeptidase
MKKRLLSDPYQLKAVESLKDCLRIYSPSGREDDLRNFLVELLRSYGFSPQVDPAGNVLSTVGNGKPNLLFCGHMDTVPGELKVFEENGRIYGRGAVDAKSSLMAMLFALIRLGRTKDLGGAVSFCAVVDEEGSSRGINHVLSSGFFADYAVFGEPAGVDKVTIGYKGAIPATLTVETPEVHSSSPWMSKNAIEVLMDIFNSLKHNWEYPKEVSYIDRVTLCLTKIDGGTAHNVSPGKGTAHIDFRIPFGKTSEDVWNEAQRVLDKSSATFLDAKIGFSHTTVTEPYQAKLSSPLVGAVSRAIPQITGKRATFLRKTGTGDMNEFALARGIPAITYGPGDTKLSHTLHENVEIKEFETSIEVYEATALNLFRASS